MALVDPLEKSALPVLRDLTDPLARRDPKALRESPDRKDPLALLDSLDLASLSSERLPLRVTSRLPLTKVTHTRSQLPTLCGFTAALSGMTPV